MDDKDKITIDRETFRALAADSRIEILKKLDEHKLTLTDLTEKLDMSPSTVKEHLDRLSAAGLIEPIPGETKWKYYRLTRKGRNILNPYETKVWFVLAVTAVALLGVVYNLFSQIRDFNTFLGSAMMAPAAQQAPTYDAVSEMARAGSVLKSAAVENATNNAVMVASGAAEAVSTATTTLARAIETEAPKALNAAAGIPLTEVALALLLTLVAGLCIGILVKNRRFM
jgi:DNA-binding transcriptional ArsR family regulator